MGGGVATGFPFGGVYNTQTTDVAITTIAPNQNLILPRAISLLTVNLVLSDSGVLAVDAGGFVDGGLLLLNVSRSGGAVDSTFTLGGASFPAVSAPTTGADAVTCYAFQYVDEEFIAISNNAVAANPGSNISYNAVTLTTAANVSFTLSANKNISIVNLTVEGSKSSPVRSLVVNASSFADNSLLIVLARQGSAAATARFNLSGSTTEVFDPFPRMLWNQAAYGGTTYVFLKRTVSGVPTFYLVSTTGQKFSYAKFETGKTAGTNGGAIASSETWTKFTGGPGVVIDTDPNVAWWTWDNATGRLDCSMVGRYEVRWRFTFCAVDGFVTRMQEVIQTGDVIGLGMPGLSASIGLENKISEGLAVVNNIAPSAGERYEFQHFVKTASPGITDYALGLAANLTGISEVFGTVEIRRFW